MARHSNVITVNESDKIVLEKLALGLDLNLALRANIILESIDHPAASEVAKILGIDQRSVSLWKKKYQKNGVNGLVKTHGGGPQGKHVDSLDKRLLERVQQPEPWTVSSLAREFETTDYLIRTTLKRMGIQLQRVHAWRCQTTDITRQRSFSVYALYLSYDVQAIVLISTAPSGEDTTSSCDCSEGCTGVFVTNNRLLANDIHRSATPLGLTDILVAAADHSHDVLRASRPTLSAFLETVIQDIPKDAFTEYHVYAHAEKQPGFRGVSAAHITYHNVQTAVEWKDLVTVWINSLTDFSQRQDADALHKAIRRYMAQCSPSTEPFCWNRKGAFATSMTGTDAKKRVRQSAEQLLGQMEENGEDTTQVGAVVVIRDKNGVSTREVIGSQTFPDMEELDFSSPAALGRTLGKVERAIDSFVQDLALKLEKQYVDEAKKKRGGIGPTRMVPVESSRGRFHIAVPLSTARQLKPGQRILTADYQYKISSVAIDASFRNSVHSFNILLDRADTAAELPVSTFADDIVAIGQELIACKVQETRRILTEFGFDPDSGLFSGGELPADLRNHPCQMLTFSPAEIAGMTEEEWRAKHAVLSGPEQCPASLTHRWSQPDTQEFVVRMKRRLPRTSVPVNEKTAVCSDFIKRVNQSVKSDMEGILHPCRIEADENEVLYIMVDAVVVDEQEATRIKGGKPFVKEETTWIKHWNIRVETEETVYSISSLDENEAYKELIAFILGNKLQHRYFIFFVDGERAIFDAIEKYFSCWEYVVYLDWYHLSEKLYILLSMAIIAQRLPDPRVEPELVTQGKNKGKDRRKKTSLSRLYARELDRILWFGNVTEAIQYIRNIDPDHIKSRKAADDLIGYLDRKEKYIANSGIRKKAGLRNSSNGVEGLNMVNVATRQKASTMSWRKDGSSSLSAISTLFVNKEEEDWFFNHHNSFTPVRKKGEKSPEFEETEMDDAGIVDYLPDSAEKNIYPE